MPAMSTGIVSGNRIRSRQEFGVRVRRIASGLRAFGVKPGDSVAILMRNDIAFPEASFAAMTLGAYAVPINWHFKAEEASYVLTDCGAKALIGHADLLSAVGASVPAGVPVVWLATPPEILSAYSIDPDLAAVPAGAIDFEAWLAAQPPYEGPTVPQPQSMIYTSGTTGHPKGVRRKAPTAREHEVNERLRALVYGVIEGARCLLPGPLYHSAPNSFGLRAARLAELLVLMPRFDAETMLQIIARERIEAMFMVPTMFIRLLKLPEAVRRQYDVSSLRHVIHAAAPCPSDVKRAMIEWWGPIIYEFYGGTENGPVTFATSEDSLRKPGTVGRASPGAQIRILDDDGKQVPTGVVGEIYARIEDYPDFVYHNLPDKTAEVLRDSLITLGDMGYFDDEGYLFVCDRKRDMVISGGVNIYPAEIEAVIHAIPGVQDCAVFGVPDAEFGEALMAVVEPRPGVALNAAALRSEMAGHLADYKIPQHIEIRTGLPREDSGKIFKRRLRDPYWEKAGRRI
jgi:long-chain acyl-CoA synthetase